MTTDPTTHDEEIKTSTDTTAMQPLPADALRQVSGGSVGGIGGSGVLQPQSVGGIGGSGGH
jgi:hypothetical protein